MLFKLEFSLIIIINFNLKIESNLAMADVREMRIFSAEQIVVPEELPQILKDFSKEVIRNNPNDIVRFSREYFTRKAAESKIRPKK